MTPSRIPWGPLAFVALALYPLIPGLELALQNTLGRSIGTDVTNLFIFAILALGLNVVVGYTGLLHLGIAAFFGIGAYLTGIFTIPGNPFQFGFLPSLVIATMGAALLGVLLAVPTLRLRGDYLALVTLGFGEVTRYTLRNLDEITGGNKGLNPIPAPNLPNPFGDWRLDYRAFYYLCLGVLIVVWLLLRNIERSRLGRSWVALREDELAANCMGLNPARLKLAAFALAAGLAGLAGCLYATRLGNTAEPGNYDFNRSIIPLCCLILGGLGNRNGVLLGVLIIVGFDNTIAQVIDRQIQSANPSAVYLTFSFWKLALFGLVLVLMMRFRPEGLLPSERIQHELHPADAEGTP